MPRWLLPLLLVILLLVFAVGRVTEPPNHDSRSSVAAKPTSPAPPSPAPFDPAFLRLRPTVIASIPYTQRLTAPLGSETGALTYNAQPFLLDRHLGDDLNGIGGWNSDFADPVHALANGLVSYAGKPSPGWGKSITIAHRNNHADPTEIIQSFYAHLSTSNVAFRDQVAMADQIGNVGSADGRYLAHLHFEIRKGTTCDPGKGYHSSPLNRISPTLYLNHSVLQPFETTLLPSILRIVEPETLSSIIISSDSAPLPPAR